MTIPLESPYGLLALQGFATRKKLRLKQQRKTILRRKESELRFDPSICALLLRVARICK